MISFPFSLHIRPTGLLWLIFLLSAAVSTVASAQEGNPRPAIGATDNVPPENQQSTGTEAGAGNSPPGGAPAAAATESDPDAIATDEASAATQVASFAVTQLKDSPAVVTVISGEDIRTSGARDLVDILYLVPGYFMGVDTQGVVGPGFRGLWGQEGKILLLIDGKEMNELLFSSMQLGNEFPVELIERVEVVRGPGSVIYGGSAELSVINIVTRSLQGSTDVTAHATYGQMTNADDPGTGFARRKISLSGRYVVDAVPGLSTFLSLSLGQGQRSVRSFIDNLGAAATMENQSALNPSVIQGGIGYRDIQATFLYHRISMTTISGFGQALPAPARINFDAYHGELIGTFRPSSRFEIVPRFNATYQTPWNVPDPMNDFYYNKSVRRLRGRLLGRWAALDQLQVTAGGDAIFDHARLLSPAAALQTQFGTSDSISYQTFGAFLELFSENPIVNVAAGARYDHLSSVGGALVPRLVLLRTFGPVSLKGLFSLSFRAPGIENLNSAERVRSERTRVYEFEAAVDVTSQQRLSANVYDMAIQSPIAYIVNTDPATMMVTSEGYINLGRQGTRGFEVAYRLRTPMLKMEANYSFYAPSVANNTPAYNVPGHSGHFLAAPAHRGSVRATVRPFSWLGITPSAIILGQRYTKGPPDAVTGADTATEIPAQVLGNLFIYSDKIGIPGMSVGLGIYNILGVNYRYIRASSSSGYDSDHAPMPGLDREVMLRLSYAFEPS